MTVKENPHKPGPKKRRRVDPPGALPPLPRGYLPAVGRKWYAEIGGYAAQKGIISKMDGGGLALAAGHFAIAMEALKVLREQGPTAIDERGLSRKNPAGQILRDNSAAFRSWCKELGLTPISRASIVATEEPMDDITAALFASIAGDMDDG